MVAFVLPSSNRDVVVIPACSGNATNFLPPVGSIFSLQFKEVLRRDMNDCPRTQRRQLRRDHNGQSTVSSVNKRTPQSRGRARSPKNGGNALRGGLDACRAGEPQSHRPTRPFGTKVCETSAEQRNEETLAMTTDTDSP